MTKRILVVEDQADLRGILRDLLTGSGYEVVEAADGVVSLMQTFADQSAIALENAGLFEEIAQEGFGSWRSQASTSRSSSPT